MIHLIKITNFKLRKKITVCLFFSYKPYCVLLKLFSLERAVYFNNNDKNN